MKPLIGITVNVTKVSTAFSRNQDVELVGKRYIDVINDFGGIPLLLSNRLYKEDISCIIDKLSGILFTGGEDIQESSYSYIQFNSKVQGTDQISIRDRFELNLYHLAKKAGIPVLGICRGMQLINVAERGTLFLDLPETKVCHFIENDGWINYHAISIKKDSLIFRVMKESKYFISSLHHQGVDKLGNGLRVSAVADDGLPEIIEGINSRFLIGIQGHPENTRINLFKYDLIFKEFIDQAIKYTKC